jgi:hypothetical protein
MEKTQANSAKEYFISPLVLIVATMMNQTALYEDNVRFYY